MPNALTGDFDAVLLIRVARINALLATLHQNGADEDASPTFPHSVRLRIGDPPRGGGRDFGDLAEMVNEIPRGGGSRGGGSFLDTVPPGARRALEAALAALQDARVAEPSTLTVRGTVQAQLSAPSISLPAGPASQVAVHVHVRARYVADAARVALPEPLHGRITATYRARTKRLTSFDPVKVVLEVEVSDDDAGIRFEPAPGSGLSPFDAELVSVQVRRTLRETFEPVNVPLPSETPFARFKGLGGGEALALPIRLTPPLDLSASALDAVTQNFLGADFSIALAREFVDGRLGPALQGLSQFETDVSLAVHGTTLVTFHVSVTDVALEWKIGRIDLVVSVRASAPIAVFAITVRQGLTVSLDTADQRVTLHAADEDLSISGVPGDDDRVRDPIRAARDQALPGAQSMISAELSRARAQLNGALASIDDSASAQYGAIRVTPDGLILDGGIFTKVRRPPVVQFAATSDGAGFTAFRSWVRGGRITHFDWSWIETDGRFQVPWAQAVGTASTEHEFTLPRPSPTVEVTDVCLRVRGVQIDRLGQEVPITEGEACAVETPEVAWRVPTWSDPMMMPIWAPGTAPDTVLDDAITGHVNVLAHSAGQSAGAAALVHLVGADAERPLDALGQALAGARHRGVPLVVVLVLPSGTFGGRRREVEARLGSLGRDRAGRLLLTEDYTGSWSRTFGATTLPSTYLMNARGEFAWKHEGPVDGQALAAAIDAHALGGRSVPSRALRPGLRIGDRAPRILVRDDRGEQLALQKLRGHSVHLAFWQSWSAPCLRELRRLEARGRAERGGAPVIVAVNGGEPAHALAEVRRAHGLTFALVPDPSRRLARELGVHCWPTTLTIDPDGIVEHVQVGIAPVHGAGPRPSVPSPPRTAA